MWYVLPGIRMSSGVCAVVILSVPSPPPSSQLQQFSTASLSLHRHLSDFPPGAYAAHVSPYFGCFQLVLIVQPPDDDTYVCTMVFQLCCNGVTLVLQRFHNSLAMVIVVFPHI